VWLVANSLSPAPELLDPEVHTWECVSSRAIDRLKSGVNTVGWIFCLPEKFDDRALLNLAHLTLGSVENR
jgi:hypothetical protein